MGFIATGLSALGSFLGTGTGLGLLGLGTAALTYAGMSSMMSGMNKANQGALTTLQNDNASVLDNLPEPPEAPTGNEADDSAAEQERQKQLAAIAEAEQKNMVNPTGGLGVPGGPNAAKKELIGA